MLLFAAVTMNWFRVRCRWWELALLSLACVLLFRPDFFMDQLAPEYKHLPGNKAIEVAQGLPEGGRLVMVIKGMTIEGEDEVKTVAVRLGPESDDGRKRLAEAGLTLSTLGEATQIAGVKFGSRAKKSGFEQGWEVERIEVPSGRPTPHWFYLPAFALVGLVWWVQGRRLPRRRPAKHAAA